MKFIREIKDELTIIAITAMFFVFYSTSFTGHYHITPEGFRIYHCHPYKDAGTDTNPVQHHQHSRLEMSFYDAVANAFYEYSSHIIIHFNVIEIESQDIVSNDTEDEIYGLYTTTNHLRAPPAC